MSQRHLLDETPGDEAKPLAGSIESNEEVHEVIQKRGPVDKSIKMNQERLRRLEQESKTPDATLSNIEEVGSRMATQNVHSISHSTSSIASSATLHTPANISLPTTTLQVSFLSDAPTETSCTFQKGHGVCCNPEVRTRYVNHDSSHDITDPTFYNDPNLASEPPKSARVMVPTCVHYMEPPMAQAKRERKETKAKGKAGVIEAKLAKAALDRINKERVLALETSDETSSSAGKNAALARSTSTSTSTSSNDTRQYSEAQPDELLTKEGREGQLSVSKSSFARIK